MEQELNISQEELLQRRLLLTRLMAERVVGMSIDFEGSHE